MLLLFWSFAGVGIVADAFMDAITVITSTGKWHTRVDPTTGLEKNIHVKKWNATIANLSLMALGSSAPEIMLSIIEIVTGDYYSGPLGPSTIVGSAAFNMLVILAVCVSAPEAGDIRKIKDFSVFGVTAFCSVFAYLWLLFILEVRSANIVTLPEGVLSFLFFPLMVGVAYAADKGAFSKSGPREVSGFVTQVGMDSNDDGAVNLAKNFSAYETSRFLQQVDTEGKTKEELAKLVYEADRLQTMGRTRADYRKEGVAMMTGKSQKAGASHLMRSEARDATLGRAQIGFECTRYSCKESVYALEVAAVRVGDASRRLHISYTTKENQAVEDKFRATEDVDYHKAAGTLTFHRGEMRKTFEVRMINDDEVEEDETFLIELSNCTDDKTELLESRGVCEVTIISDDYPGVMVLAKVPAEDSSAEEPRYLDYYTATPTMGSVACLVRREKGSSGEVSVRWRTVADTGKAGVDYGTRGSSEELSGTLKFRSAMSEAHIVVPILNNPSAADAKGEPPPAEFKIELFDPQGGCSIGEAETTERGACGWTTVSVKHDAAAEKLARDIARLLDEHYDDIRSGDESWKDQFTDAVTPHEEMDTLGTLLFYMNMPWRVAFALIPPPSMAGGWLCFWVALGGIAVVTVLVGDLAALLGCSVGLEDSITAITFVALGTSLPDTFASKAATLGDDCADAAIGNVTGSNSVNVFLGLGLPWFIAAVVWTDAGPTAEWKATIGLKNPGIVAANPDGGFAVPAGSLSFSVAVFCACAVMCLSTLLFRRVVFGAELGARTPGASHHKLTSVFFAALWFFYVAMSIIQTWKLVEQGTLYAVLGVVVLLFAIVLGGLFAKLNGTYDTSDEGLGLVDEGSDGAEEATVAPSDPAATTETVENPSAEAKDVEAAAGEAELEEAST